MTISTSELDSVERLVKLRDTLRQARSSLYRQREAADEAIGALTEIVMRCDVKILRKAS